MIQEKIIIRRVHSSHLEAHKMNYSKGLLCLLLVTVLTGCASMEVSTEHDTSFNFSPLKTYTWLPNPQEYFGNPKIDKSVLEARIQTAVDRELAAKKYMRITSGTPDFHVRYHAVAGTDMQVENVSDSGSGMSGDWNDQRLGFYRKGGGKSATYSWDKGTLLLDMVNPENNKIIWIGTAAAKIGLQDSAEKKEERINRAVSKLLANFPPQ
jgi:hypothetical protein